MGNKALIRVLILFAIVGVIALIMKLAGPSRIETIASSTDREKVFATFPINDVAQIRVASIDGELNLTKSADGWTVAERENYPANAASAVSLLRTVWDLKIVQSPEIGPSQYARLSLEDPAKGSGESSATVVSFLDADGNELESLWLGKLVERETGPPTPYGPSTTEAGRYVKTGDEDSVFLISEPFTTVEIDPSTWLDDQFFQIAKLKSIAIDTGKPEDNWKLVREEENGDFTLVAAKEDEELDNLKVGSMKNAFSSPRFEDVIVGEEAKENAPSQTTFSIETFDGFSYTVKLSEKSEANEFYLTFEVEGNFPDKRKPVEEETDDETKERDAVFATELQSLKEKLASQKAMAGKVYKVRSYVADPIVKTREEIMKSDEEPVPGAPGGATFTPGAMPPGGMPPGALQEIADGILSSGGGGAGAAAPETPAAPSDDDKKEKSPAKPEPKKEEAPEKNTDAPADKSKGDADKAPAESSEPSPPDAPAAAPEEEEPAAAPEPAGSN